VDPIIWAIAAVFSPLLLLTFLSHQAGEKIRHSKSLWVRAVGLSLVGAGWLGYSLLAFLIVINFVTPLAAWTWFRLVN
jgi:hypothetical protein